ncbi:MAG: Ger(x)C family spore germination protein [Tumebacillaceae bacterium]
MSKRRRLLSLLAVILLMMPLVGCYDRVELEGMAFVISMGIDKGPGNTIDVTASIAVPRKLAGGTGGGGGGGGGDQGPLAAAKPITVRARSIPQALDLLNTTVERRVSLTHLSNFGISERLARDGFVRYVRPLTRYREFRRTVFMYVVPGSMREQYEKNQPVLEQSVTRFTESVADVGRYTGMTPRQYFHEFITSIEAPNEDPIAPIVAVNAESQKPTPHGKSDASTTNKSRGSEEEEGKAKPSFKPGDVVRRGGNSLEFIGTAVFRKDKLVAFLDGIETRMMMTVRGDLLRTEMDFPDLSSPGDYVSLELKHARKPVVEVDLDAKPVQVKVKQSLEGDFVGSQSMVDYTQPAHIEKLEAEVRQRIEDREKAIINKMFHEYQADPFAIFKHTRGEFLTYQDFQNYDFRKAMKTAQVDVQVDVKLRRVGVQLAPVIPE